MKHPKPPPGKPNRTLMGQRNLTSRKKINYPSVKFQDQNVYFMHETFSFRQKITMNLNKLSIGPISTKFIFNFSGFQVNRIFHIKIISLIYRGLKDTELSKHISCVPQKHII